MSTDVAQRRAQVTRLIARIARLEEALVMIRDADPVDMALDPNWPARIAKDALER